MTGSSFDINTVIADALQIITKPGEFYRRMPHSGGYVEPMIFLVVMAVTSGLLFTILSVFGAGMAGMLVFGVWAVIVFPIAGLIGSFVSAAVMFIIWKLMGSEKTYETAYRCVAHASAIYPAYAILSLIPYVGGVVYIAWIMYLMVIASIAVHGIAEKKAYIVFGVLGALFILGNLSSERHTRHMQSQYEQMGMNLEGMENKTPEEMGKMVGEFMKGMEEAQQQQ